MKKKEPLSTFFVSFFGNNGSQQRNGSDPPLSDLIARAAILIRISTVLFYQPQPKQRRVFVQARHIYQPELSLLLTKCEHGGPPQKTLTLRATFNSTFHPLHPKETRLFFSFFSVMFATHLTELKSFTCPFTYVNAQRPPFRLT